MKIQLAILTLASLYIIPQAALAEDKIDLSKGLAYPELEVTPRASDRLFLEAKDERSNRFNNYGAMMISSMATLVTAFTAQDSPDNKNDKDIVDNNKWSTQVGYAVGGGWLLTNILMMTSYEPYRNGYKDIKNMPSSNKREELTKERLAEENLYAPARLGTRLLWLSAITNFTASVYMMDNGDDNVKVYGAVSAIASLAPIFFPYRWIDVANQHRLYKKKIYGPIASLTFLSAGNQKPPQPGVGLTWSW